MNKLSLNTFMPGLLSCLLLLGACATSSKPDPDRKTDERKAAEDNTALGLEYMRRGQYEVSMGKLKKAIREDPGYAPGHTVLAILYERIGEDEFAGKHYEKAVKADPKNGDVNNNYGVYLCKTGREKDAIHYFHKALEDPFYATPAAALTNAGTCEIEAGNLDEADGYLRAALKYNQTFPGALLAMADLNYQQGDFLRSRAFMQRFEATALQTAENLFLAYKIEIALRDDKMARKYLSLLNSNFPQSKEAEEARSIKRT